MRHTKTFLDSLPANDVDATTTEFIFINMKADTSPYGVDTDSKGALLGGTAL